MLRSGFLTSYLSGLSCKYCVWFSQNPYCREVYKGCLPYDKSDSDKAIHNLQLTSAWIRS